MGILRNARQAHCPYMKLSGIKMGLCEILNKINDKANQV